MRLRCIPRVHGAKSVFTVLLTGMLYVGFEVALIAEDKISAVREAGAGGLSPQGVFEKAQSAYEAGNWHIWYNCHTKRSSDRMIIMTIETGVKLIKHIAGAKDTGTVTELKAQMPGYLDVLARHGIDEELMLSIPTMREMRKKGKVTTEQRKSAMRQIEELAERIPDRGKFVVDWLEATHRFEQRTGKAMPNLYRGRTLTNVKIGGKAATGTVVLPDDKQGIGVPVYFRQVHGRWKIDEPGREGGPKS